MNEKIPFLPVEELTPRFVLSALSEVQDWGLLAAGVPDAWQRSRGAGITVAVLDTGAPDHIDLNDNLLPGLNCAGTKDEKDRQGHGTHVAGIVAAVQNGIGVVGVAPEAKVLPVKVLDDSGRSSFQSVIDGIRVAMEHGADIINMSLGSPTQPPKELHAIIREANARGIIIIAAAGNDGGAVNYPAHYDEVIAVAALAKDGKMARFSSRGTEVDAVAPGVDIYSTYLNNQYALLNGTSQAAPFMAGACALLLSWSRNTPGVPPIKNSQEMLQRLDDLCDPSGRIHAIGRDGSWGFGIPSFANYMPWRSQ
jgi:subtilisin family serine protease